MNWWQIAATCLAGWGVGWPTVGRLVRDAIDPPWVVRVTGGSGVYIFRSTAPANNIQVVLCRRFRDSAYNKNCVTIGTLRMDEEDFDEKVLDLRDQAREKAKRINALREVIR